MHHLGLGPVNAANSQRLYKSGRFGWRVAGGGGVVGSEPVHDSLHVTYRLLAPGTEPSRGPQPINLFIEMVRNSADINSKRNQIALELAEFPRTAGG